MKKIIYLAIIVMVTGCEKKDYPAGVSELEHHYYAIFVPNNNTGVSVLRNQSTLIKFPVQFYSTFIRNYDAVAKYKITTAGITTPAIVGQDFSIVDKNGVVIPSADSTYSIVFPQAKQATDTIYIRLLNNPAPGTRKLEIQMLDNITAEFDVDIFSTAYRRPVEIR